ncbi:acetolactate synthase [Synergistales bacterium]|nr:acetolactate synthase [Synergistales bacterium]
MIKLSDYVFKFIAAQGVKHVFMLPGGGCIHLCNSLGHNKDIEYIPMLHEQAVSIAAEAYGQHTNRPGVCLVTSGPGATNAITGVTAGWIDSTPMLIISGQAKSEDLVGDKGVRQIGCQEAQIIPMAQHITKYAVSVLEPSEIKYHLEKAFYLAEHGRKGPVWIEIPLDIQGAMIDESKQEGFTSPEETRADISKEVSEIVCMLKDSKQPLILVGNGVKLSGSEDKFLGIAKALHIPALTTWKIMDIFDHGDELFFGSPGLLAQRYANFILQSADLLLVLGSRLDYSLTAYNNGNFAKNAKKILVDIDANEINKLEDMDISLKVVTDMSVFFDEFGKRLTEISEIKSMDRAKWFAYCNEMKNKYPVVTTEHHADTGFVNTYAFINKLSDALRDDDIIVPESSGNAGEVTYQALRIKRGQKMKNAAGLGSMGFGLPYAIGACLASGGRRTILINGDGAFQLNIQELATLVRLSLPVKIFIWDNDCYATIMATQRNLFDGSYVGSERHSGLALPDVLKVAAVYGLKTFEMNTNDEIPDIIQEVLNSDGPALCRVRVSPLQTVAPKVQSKRLPDGKMTSNALEDMWPYLE